jgi:hypothetical protein
MNIRLQFLPRTRHSHIKCGFHVLGRATKNMIMFIVKVEFTCVFMNFHRMCNYLYL